MAADIEFDRYAYGDDELEQIYEAYKSLKKIKSELYNLKIVADDLTEGYDRDDEFDAEYVKDIVDCICDIIISANSRVAEGVRLTRDALDAVNF